MNFILSLCIFLSCLGSTLTTDYCKSSLCSPGKKHIGCNNDAQINAECASTSSMIDLSPYKDQIVDGHNEKRNRIASGKESPYLPAERMATMSWDNELTYLAELNVKTCKFDHDDCRNTDTFQYSGQNLYVWKGHPALSFKEAIKSAIDAWYNEHKDADMSVIRSFHSTSKPTGHFTVMVADRNYKTGCGMLKTEDGGQTRYLFACNYAATNIRNRPIYIESNTPASGCKTGTNKKYPALCAPSDPIPELGPFVPGAGSYLRLRKKVLFICFLLKIQFM